MICLEGVILCHIIKIIETYNQLINPNHSIPEFITELTGITNEMVMNRPTISMVKNDVLNFLGDHIIIGHNTSFDLNFIKTKFNTHLPNKYMDTLQFSRKLYPELKQHRLVDMVTYLNLSKLGNNDYCKSIKDGKSTKQKKAEKLKLSGQDIEVIDEYTFYKLMELD